jgi:hypothetical protein
MVPFPKSITFRPFLRIPITQPSTNNIRIIDSQYNKRSCPKYRNSLSESVPSRRSRRGESSQESSRLLVTEFCISKVMDFVSWNEKHHSSGCLNGQISVWEYDCWESFQSKFQGIQNNETHPRDGAIYISYESVSNDKINGYYYHHNIKNLIKWRVSQWEETSNQQ